MRAFPLQIGPFGVLAFHNLQPEEATQIHLHCRSEAKSSTAPSTSSSTACETAAAAVETAAVLDHAYIFSPLQLAVILHRLQHMPMAPGGRGVHLSWLCKAASVSHNTKSLLACLPAGPETTAVVIVWRSAATAKGEEVGTKRGRENETAVGAPIDSDHQCAAVFEAESAAICRAVRRASATAQPHRLTQTESPAAQQPGDHFYAAYAQSAKVQALYSLADRPVGSAAVRTSESPWAAMERIIVNRLSTYDV